MVQRTARRRSAGVAAATISVLAVALLPGVSAIAAESVTDVSFDFGPVGSASPEGWIGVDPTVAYSPELGYGFTTAPRDAKDRGGEDLMRGDFVNSTPYEFVVDVPNGLYNVTAWMGDIQAGSGNRTNLEIEGTLYPGASTPGGEVREQTFSSIAVADGQLTIKALENVGRLNGLHVYALPTAPTGLVASDTDPAAGAVTLAWDAMPEATGYTVYRTGGGQSRVEVGTTTEPTFTDTGLIRGEAYTYTVSQQRGQHSSPDSDPVEVTVVDPDAEAPAPPTGLRVEALERESATIAWDTAEDALEWMVYRTTQTDIPFELIARVDEPTYTDSDVFTTIPYLYQVVAVGAGGSSEASASLTTETTERLVRPMERLDRGVVAVRASETDVHVSWRLLGLDPTDLGFVLERSTGGAPYKALASAPLTGGTSFLDTTADLSKSNAYRVRPVIDGKKQAPSKAFTLSADHAIEPIVRIPLREGKGPIKFTWTGDLDGDGAYDYLVDRHNEQQQIEAYRSDGTFLWSVDFGYNSIDQHNVEGGSATIDVGHNDGVSVYDFDSDGKAEVAIKLANGVTFGDGQVFAAGSDDLDQYVAILDGETGTLRATAPFPDDYVVDGALYTRFSVGYLDGETPSLIAYMKNRIGGGQPAKFNLAHVAWNFDGEQISELWQFHRGSQDLHDGHNSRIVDLDGDGRDEIVEIAYALNSDGTLRYSLTPQDIRHGDRYYITDIDPARPGLEGYGIQQTHEANLLDYYYDASSGEVIWKHFSNKPMGEGDAGRGNVADVDPRFPGLETYTLDGEPNWEASQIGLWNAATNQLVEADTAKQPWPGHNIWWDGDQLREIWHANPTPDNRDARVTKWDWENPTNWDETPTLLRTEEYGAVTASGGSVNYLHVGDIFGDWREEIVLTTPEFDELVIFTTDIPTDQRLYTLAHNPLYRSGMNQKGYVQSGQVDYFLGHGMEQPPTPDIRYAGDEPATDTVRPEVSLVAPSAGLVRELQIQVNASDAGGLEKIVANVYRGSQLVKSTQTSVNGASSGTHAATVQLPDGAYTIKFNAHDWAGNVSRTGAFDVVVDATAPTATVKDGPGFTRATGDTFDVISYKLYDAGKIDRVELNGVAKDLSNNAWSDVNGIRPGVFGAVSGPNVLVVFDVAGNSQSYRFTLN